MLCACWSVLRQVSFTRTRGRPLSKVKAAANRAKSRIRARIEHVFGAQQTGGRLVRTIGIVRARAKIGLQNLVYNIRRLATLERMAAAYAWNPSVAVERTRRAKTLGSGSAEPANKRRPRAAPAHSGARNRNKSRSP